MWQLLYARQFSDLEIERKTIENRRLLIQLYRKEEAGWDHALISGWSVIGFQSIIICCDCYFLTLFIIVLVKNCCIVTLSIAERHK